MFKLRTSAIAAAGILLGMHAMVLLLRYGTESASLWGDVIGASAAPLLAAIVAWLVSRSAQPFARRVWRLVSLSLLLSSAGGVLYTYLFDFVRKPPDAYWPSDVLVFFWTVPAMTTLFLSPRDPGRGFRWLRFCDFVQVCALVLAIELSQLYIPSRWEQSEHAMAVRAVYAGIVFFGLLALSFLARGLTTTSQTARGLFLRLAIFFFVFGIATNLTLYGYAAGNYQQGTWLDLLWTGSFGLFAVMTATWTDPEQEFGRNVSVPSRGTQLLSQFFPLLIPAVVFALVLRIAQEQFWWSVVLVISSFAAASVRLFVVQNQLLVSSHELQKNLALLQGITDGTTDAVFVKDLQGRYLMINAAGARFLGLTIDEVLGKNDTELFTPEIGQFIMERDRVVVESGEAQTYEEDGSAGGVTRLFLSTKGPYRDPNGEVIGLLGICRDITDRRRAEEEIRQSQQKVRIHFEHTPLAVVEWDLNHCVTAWNPSAERIFGYLRDEAMGKHASFLFLRSFASM
jgi:PAS domain S-box-containing protein